MLIQTYLLLVIIFNQYRGASLMNLLLAALTTAGLTALALIILSFFASGITG
jgi:hypothetical protein